jgi:hypothetical protein
MMRYSFVWNDSPVTVDTASQSLRISLDEDYADFEEWRRHIHAHRDEARPDGSTEGSIHTIDPCQPFQPTCYPSFAEAWKPGFAPLTLFAAKAKQVDDGIIAGIELALEQGPAGEDGRAEMTGFEQDRDLGTPRLTALRRPALI